MRRFAMLMFALVLQAALLPAARAERPPESAEDATHIVVGTVESVFSYETRSNHHYVVKLIVESVEKGDGVAEGDAFYVECFQRKKSAPQIPAPYGHKAIPKAEQRIRALIVREGPRSEGIYPRWFDVKR
ncbi:MAG: hypothetical protein JNM18_13520 [Planctomycetaceae bacterium]|nr:hypothetical protein [Planctomycetaceae bacterium]